MRFTLLTDDPADTAELDPQYRAAREIGTLRIAESGLFFRAGLKKYYVPYTSVNRAFRRVIAVPAKLCCTTGDFEIENLVIARDETEFAQIQLPGRRAAEEVMKLLKEKMPDADFTALHAKTEDVKQGTVICEEKGSESGQSEDMT